MRALVQRVSSAAVRVDSHVVGEIGIGLLVLVCAIGGDTEITADRLARKIVSLRIFDDEFDRMNKSVLDIKGSILIVSQFTLAADTRSNRPSFLSASPPQEGRHLCHYFSTAVARSGVPVAEGIFGAEMEVTLVNSGPVTIWLDTSAS